MADAAAGAAVGVASEDSVAEGAGASEGLAVVEDSVVAVAARAGRSGKWEVKSEERGTGG